VLLVFLGFKRWIVKKNGYFLLRNISTGAAVSLILVGGVATILAELPYLMLGHSPRFHGWDSRHQLLMPFGVAILSVGLIAFFKSAWIKNILFLTVVSICTAQNISAYFNYYRDWVKQKEVMRVISNQPLIRDGRIIVFQ